LYDVEEQFCKVTFKLRGEIVSEGKTGDVEIPENEYEKDEECKKRCDVVHCLQHDEQLVAKRRQKANQLQYTQQTECP